MIHIPIYDVYLDIFVSDDEDVLIEKFNSAVRDEDKLKDVFCYDAVTLGIRSVDHKSVISILFDKDKISAGLIAHEALHVVVNMKDFINTPLNNSTEEEYAYLLGYVVQQITDFVYE